MQKFIFNDTEFLKITPAKRLFNSTLVHEVINRGDIFALNTSTGIFTVISGKDFREAIQVKSNPNNKIKELLDQLTLELNK